MRIIFVHIDIGETEETDQGYAKELSQDQIKMQQDGMKKVCSQSDVVITTAQVFGRPAPKIVTKDMVNSMKPGSVLIDMAVSSGGNIEGSVENEIITNNGVMVVGLSNLPAEVAMDASLVYGNNLFNFILLHNIMGYLFIKIRLIHHILLCTNLFESPLDVING